MYMEMRNYGNRIIGKNKKIVVQRKISYEISLLDGSESQIRHGLLSSWPPSRYTFLQNQTLTKVTSR